MFTTRHMMVSKVRGLFEKFTGTVELDEAHPENTRVDIQIETASINTRDTQRDAHLRSADFFNADVNPYMTFKSKRVERTDSRSLDWRPDHPRRDQGSGPECRIQRLQ
jgi:polyisoprenoid-binding protein YceI